MRELQFVLMLSLLSLPARFAAAEPMMGRGMEGMCPMCGTWGWAGMLLGLVLVLAVIALLVAATVYLIRRSRH